MDIALRRHVQYKEIEKSIREKREVDCNKKVKLRITALKWHVRLNDEITYQVLEARYTSGLSLEVNNVKLELLKYAYNNRSQTLGCNGHNYISSTYSYSVAAHHNREQQFLGKGEGKLSSMQSFFLSFIS